MKIKKKSGSKAENLRNLKAQPKPLVSYKKTKKTTTTYIILIIFDMKHIMFGNKAFIYLWTSDQAVTHSLSLSIHSILFDKLSNQLQFRLGWDRPKSWFLPHSSVQLGKVLNDQIKPKPRKGLLSQPNKNDTTK